MSCKAESTVCQDRLAFNIGIQIIQILCKKPYIAFVEIVKGS
jgi:hypothetical protein